MHCLFNLVLDILAVLNLHEAISIHNLGYHLADQPIGIHVRISQPTINLLLILNQLLETMRVVIKFPIKNNQMPQKPMIIIQIISLLISYV